MKKRKKIKSLKGQVKYYQKQQKGYGRMAIFRGAAKERFHIYQIEGGFLISEVNQQGAIQPPIQFKATPNEVADEIRKELTVKALTK